MERYRLTSLEKPTDEQFAAVMAHESTRKAKETLDAKMEELRKFADAYITQQNKVYDD